MKPGSKVPLTHTQFTVTIPGTLITEAIEFLHATHVSGSITTLDINATDSTASTSSVNLAKKALKFAFTNLNKYEKNGLTLTEPAKPATESGWVAKKPGKMVFSPGKVVLTANFGSAIMLASASVPKVTITTATVG